MRQAVSFLEVQTRGKGLYEFTGSVRSILHDNPVRTGLLTLFCRHTSASLLVQENADPDVQEDLRRFFEAVAPEGAGYVHASEGPDDMPAHIRAALTQTQLTIPIADGRMVLGTWQGLYLFEHRRAPHHRSIALHLLGE